MFPSLLFFCARKTTRTVFKSIILPSQKSQKVFMTTMSDSHLIKRGTKVITAKKILFTIFNLQTLSDRIVLIVRRQMTVLAWQMTANLWTEAVHSSWQIIHQKWKIALRSPCDNRRPFPMKWPIGGCNSTIMHKSDWEMVSEFLFFWINFFCQ